jgi:hypothetical protein
LFITTCLISSNANRDRESSETAHLGRASGFAPRGEQEIIRRAVAAIRRQSAIPGVGAAICW